MKIQKTLNFREKIYDFLTDDTREIAPDTLFVRLPQNEKFFCEFCSHATSPPDFMEFSEMPSHFRICAKIIGISGTNGKTTTAHLLHFALNRMGFRSGMIGTRGVFFGAQKIREKRLTTPGFLELYEILSEFESLRAEFIVMEVSSHAIAQNRCFGINFYAKFLLNITQDHLDFHGDLETYRAVKTAFVKDFSGLKFLNANENLLDFSQDFARTFFIAPDPKHAPKSLKNHLFYAQNVKIFPEISAEIIHENDEFSKIAPLFAPLFGAHNLCNLLFVRAFLWIEFGDDARFHKIFADFPGVPGRLQKIHENPLVIVDFAHTPDAMGNIFRSFADFRIWAIFGAGGDRDAMKRPQMGAIAERFCEKIFLTSDNPRTENPEKIISDIRAGISPEFLNVKIFLDRREAIFAAISELFSQKTKSDPKTVLLILGKGDETTQILAQTVVDFDDAAVAYEAIKKNLAK